MPNVNIRRYFMHMTILHRHKSSPEEKETYALTVLNTLQSLPDCPEAIRRRLLTIIARYKAIREERDAG